MERNLFNRTAFAVAVVLLGFATIAYGAVHQAVLAASYLLIALLVVLWSIDCYKQGLLRYSTHLLQVPLFFIAVYGFIQLIPFGAVEMETGIGEAPRTISMEPFATLLSSTHFAALGLFFALLLTLVDSARRTRTLVFLLAGFGFVYAFFSILQAVLSPEKIYGIYGRPGLSVFGSFVNRNHFAAWMEMAIALPIGLLFSGAVSKDKRLLFITATVLMGAAIVVSGSRGGLVALIAEILVLALITVGAERKSLGLKVALAVGLIAAVVGGAFFIGGETSLTRIAETQSATATKQDRSQIWSVSVRMIQYGMPFGVGLGAFGTAYTQFDESGGLERVEQAHNDHLQVLTDAGLPGAAIGIAFLIIVVRSGRRALSSEDQFLRAVGAGALGGIAAVLIHSAFDFVLHTTAVALLFLFLLALLVAAGTRFSDQAGSDGAMVRRRSERPRAEVVSIP